LGKAKWSFAVGKAKRGKGTKSMASTYTVGLPCAILIENAWPHDIELVEIAIDNSFTQYAPVCMALKLRRLDVHCEYHV